MELITQINDHKSALKEIQIRQNIMFNVQTQNEYYLKMTRLCQLINKYDQMKQDELFKV
jgi:hypothetical protein